MLPINPSQTIGEVEELNQELDQRMFSYEVLSVEHRRFLDGLEVESGVLNVLKIPLLAWSINKEW